MHTVLYHPENGDKPKEFQVDDGGILYDELEKQGTELPHGCLAGSCGSCKVEIIEGNENLSDMSAVEKDTIEHLTSTLTEKHGENYLSGKTLRLSCRSKVKGNVEFKTLK